MDAPNNTFWAYTYVRATVWLAIRISFLINADHLPLMIDCRTYLFSTWFLGPGRIGEVRLI